MITLCMDTSHTWLVVGLIKDDTIIGKIQEKCWKKQSEELFPKIIELMDSLQLKPEDIDQIVISKGPGSYTGVRIAMTVAKVFCSMRNLPIYTISTLLLYAGMKNCRVIMDARGKRVYTALFKDGEVVDKEQVIEISELNIGDDEIIGDGSLVGKEDSWPDIVDNFKDLKAKWESWDNVHLVVPEYLKSSESYLPQK